MRKIIIATAVLSLVAASQADIFVGAFTDYGISDRSNPDGSVPLLGAGQRALVQLIYAGANGVADGVTGLAAVSGLAGGGVVGDDVVLDTWLSPAAVVGDFATEYAVWGVRNVTALGYAGGNVYARVFQSSGAAVGTYLYQGDIFVAGNKNTAAIPPPLADNYNVGGGTTALANIQIIPEPATFGLMGIAGLGLFLARKKTRS